MRNRFVRTTVQDREAAFAPDLVERNFVVSGSDQLWVSDITYVPTWAGFLYLAVVIDAFSRKVIGWAMETHLRTELVLAALNMAYAQRRPRVWFSIPTAARSSLRLPSDPDASR
jgi:putative transposase